MTQTIICGVDGLGKSTLIDAIIEKKGYHPAIHFQKPKVLDIHQNSVISPEYEYQYSSFVSLMNLIDSKIPMIFDRSHIGEFVYAPLYRNYNADYVFDLEKQYDIGNQLHLKLMLLICSDWQYAMNFGLVKDDGQSFDYDNKGYEQMKFKEAFERSIIPNKYMVDILIEMEDGSKRRKTTDEILKEINL